VIGPARPISNLDLAQSVIALACRFGAEDFCVCAGSRNAPLLAVLAEARGVRLFSFVDERSAAFFALGRAKARRRPVAIITTSGTAVAELLPAAVEAHYTGVPLLLITADRPRRFRDTGAPQTIEQRGIFSVFVEGCVDVDADSNDAASSTWSGRRPLHINVAFDEPLIDGPIPSVLFQPAEPVQSALPAPDRTAIEEAIRDVARPLVIIGGLPAGVGPAVRRFALRLGAPVYAEPLSGLREDAALEPLILRSAERILERGGFDGVLRIGGVPALRFWRDLEERHRTLPVISISELPFAGLSRDSLLLQGGISAILDAIRIDEPRPAEETMRRDREMAVRIEELFESEPHSEPALMRSLSQQIPPEARIFLGNSLPIREWDLAAIRPSREWIIEANRGANGIDGELSTFLGQCDPSSPNWAIVGDLTTLCDLGAPWIVRQLDADLRFVIVILNNGGGRIFSRVASLQAIEPRRRATLMENEHPIHFSDWVAMWGLEYAAMDGADSLPGIERGVLEVVVDQDATRRFWTAFDRLWDAS
jgi:2-succinyl-5-enolpyruvyl-6-hydroxy-3-cyclohexene-1-carboxylate synthase